jgi:3-hydroxyacyl-[acyl-carrier-protein] dehydratase
MVQSPYGVYEIRKILPHRNPFLLVDRVIDVVESERIVAEKELSQEHCFFPVHPPGRPIMPNVLITEALAQASRLLIGLSCVFERGPSSSRGPGQFILANIDVRFSRPAHPGQILRLESALKKEYGTLFLFMVCATVKSVVIAKGELTLAEVRERSVPAVRKPPRRRWT